MSTVLERRHRVTVIGAGVIGLSWAALFLDNGLDVTINDPALDAKDAALANLADMTRTTGWERRLHFEADLATAVTGADVIQENGPDRIRFKRQIWSDVEAACPGSTLLLSSSSGIPTKQQSKKMKHPGRLIIGHPYNPPHILPLVEVLGSTSTSPSNLAEVMEFYAAIGKHPVRLDKQLPGFVANRLHAALLKEAFWIVRSGAATPEQIDEIVTSSLGPRWAADGPFTAITMGGGPRGLEGYLDHFGRGLQLLWLHSALRPLVLTARFRARLVDKVIASLGHRPIANLEHARDAKLRALLSTLNRR